MKLKYLCQNSSISNKILFLSPTQRLLFFFSLEKSKTKGFVYILKIWKKNPTWWDFLQYHIQILSVYCDDIYRSNFVIPKSVTKHRHEYSHDIYQENHNEKKKQIVQCRVSFTDNIANKISPTIKFISEYSDGRKCPSIYSDDIKDNITVGFKKANRTVTWHFYQ
jgi:sRNA-binding carbon storage regulator CsrA